MVPILDNIVKSVGVIMPYLEIFIFIIIFLIISRLVLVSLRRKLIKKAKNKSQISDIKIFSRIFNVAIFCIVLFVAFFSYTGSWSGLGIFAGLITAGLGFALQKPITGVAAWIMIVIKRPFKVGDRVKIGDNKGEIYDISLTHIYIDETGGMADTEDHSGRNIMIPNYKLFEIDIINYTLTHDMVMGEIGLLLSFDSNIERAIGLIKEVVDKHAGNFAKQINKKNSIRANFRDIGINVKIFFYAPVFDLQDIKSKITLEIYEIVKKEKKINFANPTGVGILADR
ncbi:MAG: mechanosensitive ion channel family protein [archaeon]